MLGRFTECRELATTFLSRAPRRASTSVNDWLAPQVVVEQPKDAH
jgi:hypothetical protein